MIRVSGPSLSKVDRTSSLYALLQEANTRIRQKDASTWGKKAQAEAAIRLNWVDLEKTSRAVLPEILALVEKFKGFENLILCGMGGSSLAPEVIAQTYKKKIFVLDSTDPNYIAHTDTYRLDKTLVLVSSKSGSTLEVSSQRDFFAEKFRSAGLNPTNHMVFITDPESPLDKQMRSLGFSVINADPNVGGRFSALTAFGLVPAALLGIDPSELLDQADSAKESFFAEPALVLDVGYALSALAEQFISFSDAGSKVPGLSDWIEQLIAESTGKDQKGRLPIATENELNAKIGGSFSVVFAPSSQADLVIEGDLGAQFIFWEWVTALLGVALQVDPFNQPNVTEAKEATINLLISWHNKLPVLTCDAQDQDVEIFGHGITLISSLKNLIANTDADGYIAVMAYLDRKDDSKIRELRALLSEKSGRPVSFGWGPRFLHSTGQFHKGGQQNGSFLQITGETSTNFEIPNQPFDFKTLLMAQALGDSNALAKRKYPLLRFNLLNRSAGIDQILTAARSL